VRRPWGGRAARHR